jgi:pSer/pThr/pTyr-binding forkhead associated (FHA) protein
MIVKLRILHGKLENRQGRSVGQDVKVRGPRFVIGSDPDCSMRCQSSTVSAHHCEIRIESDSAFVQDLYSETGTFVNDERVHREQVLKAGDILRIGRLEFEVLVEAGAKGGAPKPAAAKADPVDDYISDLLVEADEEDRARRLEDPEARHFRPDPAAADAETSQDSEEPGAEEDPKKKKLQRPKKKPPAKLPPPPPITADNTVDAAEETLKKLFTKDKR